jgi:outer membrane receptor protein involved in Fe transport
VLVDGRRLMPGAPGAGAQTSSAADLNFIPSTLIDRVEVVTGGASAVYGADAVAGVVNFIMQKNYEGVRIDAQHSFYQHKNDDDRSQAVLKARAAGAFDPARFAVPEENVRDGFANDLTLVVGVNAPEGRGNITAYAGYRNIDPVVQKDRDYSACALNASDASPNLFACGGSGTTAPARIITAGGTGQDLTLDPRRSRRARLPPLRGHARRLQLRRGQLLSASGRTLHARRLRSLRAPSGSRGLHPADVHGRPQRLSGGRLGPVPGPHQLQLHRQPAAERRAVHRALWPNR